MLHTSHEKHFNIVFLFTNLFILYRMLRRDIVASACDYGSTDCLEQARSDYAVYSQAPSVNR